MGPRDPGPGESLRRDVPGPGLDPSTVAFSNSSIEDRQLEMIKEKEEGVIPDQLARILYIWRLYGIAPATLRSEGRPSKHFCITPNRRYVIISFVFIFTIISTNLSCMIYNVFFISMEKEIRVRTGISYMIHIVHVSLINGLMYSYAFGILSKIKVFIEYMNVIRKLHQELHSNFANVRIKHANVLVGGLLLVIGVIGSIYLIDLVGDMLTNSTDLSVILKHLLYFIIQQLLILLQFRFMFVVYYVNSTIDALSDRLQELPFKNMLYNVLDCRTINSTYVSMQRLSQAYISICELIKKIEKQDGVLILCLFTFKLVDVMDALFLILSSFMAEGNFTISFLLNNMLEIIWILVRGYIILIFIDSCHQTQVKLQALQIMMSHIICASNLNLRRELCNFSDRLLINNIPVIYPLGMCEFTRNQLVVVCGALFTFMVIIIQFRIQDKIV